MVFSSWTPLLLSLSLAAPIANAAKNPLNISFPYSSNQRSPNVVNDNFIGISFELSSFDTLWGRTEYGLPNPMLNYLANIRARMYNPLRIRIGGNGMDGSTYVPDKTDEMLKVTDDSYYNDIPVDYGPVFFDVLNRMASKVGSMQYLIGLSMRDPANDENVVALAKATEEKLGDSLDAMLLGNEPDLYAGHDHRDAYNITAYIPELRDMIQDFKDAGLLTDSQKLIGGPTTCCTWDLDEVLDAGMKDLNYKYYTIQHYPNNACSGENEKNTNISFYLTHTNINDYINWNQKGVNQAKAQGVPVLLTEYNSVSCGGSSISNTFAMSLWAIDVGLKAAASNYTGIYLHTREYGVKYNLFDPPESSLTNPLDANQTSWTTGSPYYSALFLAEAVSANGSVVVDLNIDNSSTNVKSTVAAYGIYDQGGTDRGKLALINYNHDTDVTKDNYQDVERSSNDTAQTFVIPAGTASIIRYRVLRAPSVWERDRISWAGQTVKENGALDTDKDQYTGSMDCDSGCEITVPGPGAALLFFQDELVYYGNSTIVGAGYLDSGEESGALASATSSWTLRLLSLVAVVAFLL